MARKKKLNAYIKREEEEGEAEGIEENTHVRDDILEGLKDPGNLRVDTKVDSSITSGFEEGRMGIHEKDDEGDGKG